MSISPVRPRASSPLGVRASDGADRASPLPRALPDSSSPLLDQTGPSMGRAYHPGCTLCSLVASLPSMNEGHDLATPSNSPFNASFNIPGVRASTSASDPLLDPPNAAGPSSSRTTSPVTTSHLPNGLAPDRQAQKLRSNRSGIFVSQKDTEGRRLPLVVAGRDVLYFDDDITVYAAKGKERLCAEGSHLIMVVNRHIGQVYDLVGSYSRLGDITFRLTARRRARQTSPCCPAYSISPGTYYTICREMRMSWKEAGKEATISASDSLAACSVSFSLSFSGRPDSQETDRPFSGDPFSPHDHLHAHALMGPVDTSAPGATFYRRNVIFGSLNWWAVEDLRAEIRSVGYVYCLSSSFRRAGRRRQIIA